MCGLLFVEDPRVTDDQIHKSLLSIRHRGPDAQAVTRISDSAVVGHVRLSILGGEAASQPLSTHNGVLVYNGEIYNHKYLDARYGVATNTSDTKTLAHMCATGKIYDGLQDVDGMFAFVYYNKTTGEWLAARDRFGIKPLYYCRTSNGIAFASEVKALRSLASSWTINLDALAHFFSYQYYPAGSTLLEEVFEVKPGELLLGRGSKIERAITYYQIEVNPADAPVDRKEVVEKYKSLLAASVSSHLLADNSHRITSYLSGGIDSSLISVMAAKAKPSSHKSYHGYFAESKLFDESDYAYATAQEADIDLSTVLISQEMINQSFLPSLACLDSPLAGPGLIPQYIMSKEVAKESKVVLGGQGGDEIFGGYARYPIAMLAYSLTSAFQAQASPWDHVMRETTAEMLGGLRQYAPMMQKLFQNPSLYQNPLSAYELVINRATDLPSELFNALSQQFLTAKSVFTESFNQVQSESFLDKMLLSDMYGQLQALLQVDDRTTMAASIESRVPFLTNSIVKEWFSEPISIRMWGVGSKAVPKHIAKQLLPNKVNNRTDKMGFPVPFDHWLKCPAFYDQVRQLFTESHILKQMAPAYRKTILESEVGDIKYNRSLWGMITLAGWERFSY